MRRVRCLQVATDPWLPAMHCACTELIIELDAAGASLASLLAMLCSSMHASFIDLMASLEAVQLKVGSLWIQPDFSDRRVAAGHQCIPMGTCHASVLLLFPRGYSRNCKHHPAGGHCVLSASGILFCPAPGLGIAEWSLALQVLKFWVQHLCRVMASNEAITRQSSHFLADALGSCLAELPPWSGPSISVLGYLSRTDHSSLGILQCSGQLAI